MVGKEERGERGEEKRRMVEEEEKEGELQGLYQTLTCKACLGEYIPFTEAITEVQSGSKDSLTDSSYFHWLSLYSPRAGVCCRVISSGTLHPQSQPVATGCVTSSVPCLDCLRLP